MSEENQPEESESNARADMEEDRLRLADNLVFLDGQDDLDKSITRILRVWLAKSLKEDKNSMTKEDLNNIMHEIPPVDGIKVPGFFSRKSLPIRTFRELIILHNMDSVPANFLQLFD